MYHVNTNQKNSGVTLLTVKQTSEQKDYQR